MNSHVSLQLQKQQLEVFRPIAVHWLYICLVYVPEFLFVTVAEKSYGI